MAVAVEYSGGWVKLWRKTMQSQMYRSLTSAQRDVMMACLMLANHEPKEWEWGAQVFMCEPGQFITSLPSIKEQCGHDVSIQMIRTALQKLSKWGFLTDESTKTGRLVTILNWDTYQQEQQTQQQTTKQTANRQPTATEEVKEGKEGKKKKSRGTASVPNPGFSIDFVDRVWSYFAKHKKGRYGSIETQGIAIRQLFELSAGNEEVAKKALRETLTNNYQGFTWYFDKRGRGNGASANNKHEHTTTWDRFVAEVKAANAADREAEQRGDGLAYGYAGQPGEMVYGGDDQILHHGCSTGEDSGFFDEDRLAIP